MATATHVTALRQALGTPGVMLGHLAILAPCPVDVSTPYIAAIVPCAALVINQGKQTRYLYISGIDPVMPKRNLPNAPVLAPTLLAPGAIYRVPTPPAGMAWFVVDVTREDLQHLNLLGYLAAGSAVLGLATGIYFGVKEVHHLVQTRRARGAGGRAGRRRSS